MPPDSGVGAVDSTIRQRTGMGVAWNHGGKLDDVEADLVRTILARRLLPEGAVQVALLQNRGFQASLADIGMAQADLAQAGLLKNPVLDTSLRFPDRLYGLTDVAVGLSGDLLDLILLPARRGVAAVQADSVRFRVAAEALDLVADVRIAYWRLRADQAVAALLRDRAAAADATASLARRLNEAGNISDLDLAREQADAEETRAEYSDALAAVAADREDLNRLMGLFGPEAARWSVPEDIPAPPPDRIPYGQLEAMAVRGNLHIASLRLQAGASARALGVARDYGWLGDVEVGVSSEKNPEGYRVTGPTLRLALPIFDRGQASRQRATVPCASDTRSSRARSRSC
jgi:cobalt-zinc-cadmium efflux system outer membrane protein